MLTWMNLLHLYQPPTQTKEVVDQIVRECYSHIPKLLRTYPHAKFTINIAGSLIELFEQYGHAELLKEYKTLIEQGKIELVGSAMYHPLLALLPENEIKHQIELNNEKLKNYFGDAYNPKGFFIPEMAYSKKVADVVKSMGFEWILIDDICFTGGSPDNTKRYTIKDNGITVLFRDRKFSKTFPPDYIIDNFDVILAKNTNTIIAHDGELYGHWHKDDRGYYEKVFTSPHITMKLVSDYVAELTETVEVEPRAASWESLPEELEAGIPYALWDYPNNEVHKALWDFANFVITTVQAHAQDQNISWARLYLDRGMASCAWWWATGRVLTQSTTKCWNPTEVEKGAQQLLTSIRSLYDVSPETKVQAEQHFTTVRMLTWKTHWEKYDSEQRKAL